MALYEDAEEYKSIDYSKLTPLLIEAIKSQQAQLEELKAQNNLLKIENFENIIAINLLRVE
ncbi:MAG: hypothetical protein ACMUJM_08510 [bacterium]